MRCTKYVGILLFLSHLMWSKLTYIKKILTDIKFAYYAVPCDFLMHWILCNVQIKANIPIYSFIISFCETLKVLSSRFILEKYAVHHCYLLSPYCAIWHHNLDFIFLVTQVIILGLCQLSRAPRWTCCLVLS